MNPNFCSSRSENRDKALAHLAAGNNAAAEECFQRAVNISGPMIKQFIEVSHPSFSKPLLDSHWCIEHVFMASQALKEKNVEFLVAPYEADAQMAYLALSGNVHAVITEDSDLLVYGCPRVGH